MGFACGKIRLDCGPGGSAECFRSSFRSVSSSHWALEGLLPLQIPIAIFKNQDRLGAEHTGSTQGQDRWWLRRGSAPAGFVCGFGTSLSPWEPG